MKKMVLANRKGLSDVVTTVLIILLALVAVAIIGTVVLKNVSKSGQKIDVLQSCQDIELTPVACNVTNFAGTKTVVVNRGADSAEISKIKLLFEKSDSTVVSEDVSAIPLAYEAKALTSTTAVKGYLVKVAAIVQSADGTPYACSPRDVKIECK